MAPGLHAEQARGQQGQEELGDPEDVSRQGDAGPAIDVFFDAVGNGALPVLSVLGGPDVFPQAPVDQGQGIRQFGAFRRKEQEIVEVA